MPTLAPTAPTGLREPAPAIIAAGVLSALLVGVALAVQVPYGIALLLAPLYAAVVLINLPLGLALWVPLAFLEGIYGLNVAGKAAGLMLALAWLASFRSVRSATLETFRSNRRHFLALAAILAWLSLTLLWADDPGLAGADLWHWYILALLFAVVVTTVTTVHTLRLVLAAFVVGAVLSVGTGLFDGSLTGAVDGGARFQGSAGDPNFLAASLIAATVLAAALFSEARSAAARVALAAAIVFLLAGLVTSGSRGGMLAAAVTVVAAFWIFKRRRAHVVAIVAVAAGVAALIFVNAPATWQRVTDFHNDNGRSDLWDVAWEMGKDYPVTGVGLNNYTVHSADYVRDSGSLSHVELIVDRPHFVHNTYLQLFADDGVIGLGLFLWFVFLCLRSGKRAADRFEARGDSALANLAGAVLVASISMLAAAVFLSAATDKRLWLLLALGPALLAVANRRPAEAPGGTDQPPPTRLVPAPTGRTLPST